MKVGILTLPLWHNYGGILQAYALRQAIENLGHEAVFLDVHRVPEGQFKLGLNRLKRSLRRAIRGSSSAPWYPDQRELAEISKNTRAFVQEKINPKTPGVTVDHAIDLAREFDALIVGSDQVWRREYMPDLATYFLALPGAVPRRVSYAASMGVDDWRFTPKESEMFAQSLRAFKAISVREDSAVALLRRELEIDAVHACDPTLLFDAGHYCQLAGVGSREIRDGGRIFTYVLDAATDRMSGLSSLVGKVGGSAFDILPKPFGPGFRRDRNSYIFPPVAAWLQAFNDCDFVITDSFHGCVFSLIFNRPFIAIANPDRGRTRFDSLLTRFGLMSRLFPSVASVDTTTLTPINWDNINKTLDEERRSGLKFLQTALELDKCHG